MPSSILKHSSKPPKRLSQHRSSPQPKCSSISSHLAMVELKSRVISSLSKLSDRDTYQIAINELERVIGSLPADGFPVVLSSLLHDPTPPTGDSSAAISGRNVVRRESVRLLSLLCLSHYDTGAAHLHKIIAHIIRRLKDPLSDSSVRDTCRDVLGSLAALYISSHENEADNVGGGPSSATSFTRLFVKPLLELMGEQNKIAQIGAAVSLAKVVECGGGGSGAMAFQKLCPRICKMFVGQSFLAKGALLSIISSLAQVGSISAQSMPIVLQSIRECLENSDWATRKSAADTLIVLASHSGHLLADRSSQIIASLEACRFDKVKPVRDSLTEALRLWKSYSEKSENNATEDTIGNGVEDLENKQLNPNSNRSEVVKGLSFDSLLIGSESLLEGKASNALDNAAVILKKRVTSLKDKELNPEFFQNLETRSSNDLPVEVVLPHRYLESSYTQYEEGFHDGDSRVSRSLDVISCNEVDENLEHFNLSHQSTEKKTESNSDQQDLDSEREFPSRNMKMKSFDVDEREPRRNFFTHHTTISRTNSPVEGSGMNHNENWRDIQKQLSQLERQQSLLMEMLQDFMCGSHDSLVALENRVRALEMVVEDMAQDLSISFGRRGVNAMMGFEGSPGRSASTCNDRHDYDSSKFVRGNESRAPYSERYLSSGGTPFGTKGRDTTWKPDFEGWDSRKDVPSGRRGLGSSPVDGKFSKNESDAEQICFRRAWGKGQGPFRHGEGPSARSVWQASKDEATLEAIRVAGDDNETSRLTARGPIAELDAEIITPNTFGKERNSLWVSWIRAMDSLHAGDLDLAYAEVLSACDNMLLVKLMERSGPCINDISGEVACELLHAIGQFMLEQRFFEIALIWIQQLMDLVMENGEGFLGIPSEVKREILLNLHEASSSAIEPPEDWEGASAEQVMLQLASAWGISIQQLMT